MGVFAWVLKRNADIINQKCLKLKYFILQIFIAWLQFILIFQLKKLHEQYSINGGSELKHLIIITKFETASFFFFIKVVLEWIESTILLVHVIIFVRKPVKAYFMWVQDYSSFEIIAFGKLMSLGVTKYTLCEETNL